MLITGLFIDQFGGLPHNETILLFGAPNSGKTLLATYLGLKFLEQYPRSYVLYVDADKKFYLVNSLKIAISNNIPTTLLSRISVTLNPDASIILSDITDFINNNDPTTLFIIIDSLPSISYPYAHKDPSQSKYVSRPIKSVKEFIIELNKLLNDMLNEYYLILVDQIRALIKQKSYPIFWAKLGFIPKYWGLIHMFIDTSMLLKRIRRDLFFLRIVSSDSLPEASGVIKIEKNFKIY